MPRHRFLLDENILYHAIRGVDAHDRPDRTAARLIETIARRCHGIVVHQTILGRYWAVVSRLQHERGPALEPLFFIGRLLNNFPKISYEGGPLPQLPQGVLLPLEDADVVRAALISRPILVTADEKLLRAVNSAPELGLTALLPRNALPLADQPAEEDAGAAED